jgi:hypothetical protein
VTGGRILNVSIPDTSRSSHTFTLNEPAGLDFLATMYDAEGWGTGGTTPVLSKSMSDRGSPKTDVQLSDHLTITPASTRTFSILINADVQ